MQDRLLPLINPLLPIPEGKIYQPNFTQIPNVIFDHWMALLHPSSFKVLLCLCRKTFGWHKTSDTISKNQIIKVTGLTKNSVQTALEELESHGLVIKQQHSNEYGCQPNTYTLVIDKPLDEQYQEPPIQNSGGGRSNFDPGVGQILTPQKKDTTKENKKILKEKIPLDEKINVREWVSLTRKEHDALLLSHGEVVTNAMLDELDSYNHRRQCHYKSDYGALKKGGWCHKNAITPKPQTPYVSNIVKHTSNQNLAQSIIDSYHSKDYELKFTNDGLCFIPLRGEQVPFTIKFNENGFSDQIQNTLKKRGFLKRLTDYSPKS